MSDNQLDPYFKFVKDTQLEEIICLLVNHSYILHTMYMVIAHTVGLYCLKSVRCRWRLVPCYARAGHIISVLNVLLFLFSMVLSIYVSRRW